MSFFVKVDTSYVVDSTAGPWAEHTMPCFTLQRPYSYHVSRGIERSSHHAVLSAFGEHIVKPGLLEHRFHSYITKSFARRNECDYLSFTVADELEVEEILNRAKEFVEACKKIAE
jgi:hypothetical protein